MRRSRTEIDFKELNEELSNAIPDNNVWTYDCELVTPLYGGSATASTVDPNHPIRVSSIRGQLRFWWRIACCEASEGHKHLFKRESAIWGGIGGEEPLASRVIIKVEVCGKALDIDASEYKPDWNCPKEMKGKPAPHNYVFVDSDPGKIITPGLRFKLHIRFNDALKPSLNDAQKEEVKRTLRWWASFGGVGARTRRGLGSITIKGLPPVTIDEVEEKGGLLKFREKDSVDAIGCWEEAIGKLMSFRQGVGVGRNHGQQSRNRPGRSRWPEADSIRNLSQCSTPDHKPDNDQTNLFPRAAFGLPIVFHFKDAPKKDERTNPIKDPIDHTLKPTMHDRMASPLILKPYWNGEHWQAAALLLPKWERALDLPLTFKENTYNKVNGWPKDPTARETAKQQIPPMKNQPGDNPLTAFMAFFEGNQR